MADLAEVTEEIAARFDLGSKGRVVVQEVLSLIAAQPGGLDGFLDKVRAAGLKVKADSWLGDPYPMALSKHEVKRAIGAEQLNKIANSVGITENFASKVLGLAIPKIVGVLATNCAVLDTVPAILQSQRSADQSTPSKTFKFAREKLMQQRGIEDFGEAPSLHLVVPAAALLITIGLFGYVISSGTAGDHIAFQTAPHVAQYAPAVSPQTSLPPSQLPPVANGASLAPTPLKSALGGNANHGDFTVKAGWVENLAAVFGVLDSQDSQSLFAANEINVGATALPADPSWKTPLFVVAELTGSGSASRGNAPVRPSTQVALDFPSIIFAANSVKVPPRSLPLLHRIAEQIKQLPPGTTVQIIGYVHTVETAGPSAADKALSQARADSVDRILIRDGVNPAMLIARGSGGSPVVASINGIAEGRSSKMRRIGNHSPSDDRRVDLRVVPQSP